MKILICLKGNFEALPVLQRAKALGHQLVVVDKDAAAAGRPLADIFVQADHYDVAATLAALHGLSLPPDGVLSCCGDTPHVAAAVAKHYGLPGLTPERAALSVDKMAQKTALHAAGLPVPAFFEITQVDGWPYWGAIIKPVDSRGARGVIWTLSNVDLDKAFEYTKAQSPTGRVMVENYLDGPQLSTESLVQDGRVLFTAVGLRNYDRLEQYAPHIIEDGFEGPYGDNELLIDIDKLLQQAAAVLGWYQGAQGGVIKGDWIVHDGKLVILELAARLSGGFFCLATEWAYGVPFIDYAIRLALGEHIKRPQVTGGMFVCQRYVLPNLDDIGRRVVSVPSLHEITTMTPVPPTLAHSRKIERDLDGNNLWAINTGTLVSPMFTAKYATYSVRPGDVLRPVIDHGARLGQAIALGNTPTLARRNAEAAVKAMQEGLVLE